MKSCNALIFSLGLVAASAKAAFVTGQVSVAGYLTAIGASGVGMATGLDFVAGSTGLASPGLPGGITGFGSGSGAFAALSCTDAAGGCGTITDIARFTTSAPIYTFMSVATGTPDVLSFDLTSLYSVLRNEDASGGRLILMGTGVIHSTGFEDTPATFMLTTQGAQVTRYSATIQAVPEPMPWALALCGCAALIARHSRRIRVQPALWWAARRFAFAFRARCRPPARCPT
jgi:hypothetical protein